MMPILYFDTIAGISGDMTVGALLDLGLPFDELRESLRALSVGGYEIHAARREVNGILATKFDVHVEGQQPNVGQPHHHPEPHGHHHEHREAVQRPAHPHRRFADIRAMLSHSSLQAPVRELALAIFHKLATAEGKVHGMATEDVTFHEVGAVDSIVDIVGAAIGFVHFGIERAFTSTLPLGSGIVHAQHGHIPVPGPATIELLHGFTTRFGDGQGELITPTGAAILATLASPSAAPPFRVQAIGYGAGTKSFADRPNLLRLVIGELETGTGQDAMIVIETNIDDGNPELFEYVLERLFEAGARDAWLAPVQMKKNRPGVVLSVIAPVEERDRLAAIVLSETTAIGVRMYAVQRRILPRTVSEVVTDYGPVRVKIAEAPGGHLNIAPEYEDCRRLASERGVPLKLVYQAAMAAARRP
jgi:uncharacterized protein (TIGR00299 family) protein